MYLEAVSFKLALNLIFDLEANGLSCTYLKVDLWDLYTGVRQKKIFKSLTEAKAFFTETYVGYTLSDRAGSIVGIEVFRTSGTFDFSIGINGDDIVGTTYRLYQSRTYDSARNESFQRVTDFQLSNAQAIVDSYRDIYLRFIDPYSTIYAFIYAKPGYFRHTTAFEAERLKIMNKEI
jgi:hypothetical protein